MLQLSQKTVKKKLCCQLYKSLLIIMHNIDLSHLQNLQHNAKKREDQKQDRELQQAAQGSSSLLSWIRPSTSKTNKGESVTLPGSEEPIMDEEGQTECRTELCSGDNLS